MHRSSLAQKCVLGNKLGVSHTINAYRMNKFLAGSGINNNHEPLATDGKQNEY
jgi:hypothetical protein